MAGIDYYTKLLLHLDGDQSGSNHNVVHNGGPIYNSYHRAVGNGSLYFNGTSAYLNIADHADWDFDGNDFTIEFRVKISALISTSEVIMYHQPAVWGSGGANQGWAVIYDGPNDTIRFRAVNAAGTVSVVGMDSAVVLNDFHHIAVVGESGGDVVMYLNGVAQTTTDTWDGSGNNSEPLYIGRANNGLNYFKGRLEELRISNSARWTSDFTVPSERYTSDANTKLLVHMEGAMTGDDAIYNVVPEGTPGLNSSEYVFGGSMWFNGSTDYLRIDDHDNWALGDIWTIDLLVNRSAVDSSEYWISQDQDNDNRWMMGFENSNFGIHKKVGGSWTQTYVSLSKPTDTWTHYAITNDGTNCRIFEDGVLKSTQGNFSIPNITGQLRIAEAFGDWEYNGYLDEIRISKGICRWTEAFTSPTAAYSLDDVTVDDEYTKLLLHGDGDQSWSYHTITHNGTPTYDTSDSVFGNSSYYDNGSGFVTLPNSSDWTLESDLCIDFRLKTTDTGNRGLFTSDNWVSANTHICYLNNGSLYLYAWWGGQVEFLAYTGSDPDLNDGNWHHIAITRSGSTWRLFIDGDQEDTYSSSNTFGNGTLSLFTDYNGAYVGGHSEFHLRGNIDEFRISKGVARWTSNFTPSTEPYTTDSYTKLLLHMEGDDGDTGHDVITHNTKQHSSTSVFNGAGSMFFDGDGDYIDVPDHDDFDFGNGSFTMDWWEYRTSTTFLRCTVSRGYAGNQTGFSAGVANPGGTDLEFFASSNGSSWDIANAKDMGALVLNTWVHHAVVRDGNDWYIFKDGVQTDTWVHSGTILPASVPLAIGVYSSGNFFAGYLDEFRISKGIARWTEDFTPPGTPYGRDLTPPVTYVTGIKGSLSETSRVIIFKESDWSVEYNAVISGSGYYEIQPLVSGTKTMVARRETDGWSQGYGLVETTEWVV